jgi:hypothetical protein
MISCGEWGATREDFDKLFPRWVDYQIAKELDRLLVPSGRPRARMATEAEGHLLGFLGICDVPALGEVQMLWMIRISVAMAVTVVSRERRPDLWRESSL